MDRVLKPLRRCMLSFGRYIKITRLTITDQSGCNMVSKPQSSPAWHRIPCKICRRRIKKAATLLRLLFLLSCTLDLSLVATAGGFDKLNHRVGLRLPPLVVSTSSTTETGCGCHRWWFRQAQPPRPATASQFSLLHSRPPHYANARSTYHY
jgi:hypothetical protein